MSSELKERISTQTVKTDPCSLEIAVEITAEDIEKEYVSVISEISKLAVISGFRKGRAPVKLIASQYEKAIKEDLETRIHKATYDKISESKINPLAYEFKGGKAPEVKRGANLAFAICAEVAPEITLPDYKTIRLDNPEPTVDPEEIEEELKRLRETYADFVKVDGPVQAGDLLKVSLESNLDTESEDLKKISHLVASKETWIWLSDPEMIPDITAAMTGSKIDDLVEFTATFPQDFREGAIAGKEVAYKIKVFEIQRRMPLDSDDELCKKLKVENVAVLKDQLGTRLKARKFFEKDADNRQEIMSKLMETAGNFPLPNSAIEAEKRSQLSSLLREIVKNEADMKKFEEEKDRHMAEAARRAEQRLRTFFLMSKIADAEGIKIDENEIENYLSSASRQYRMTKRELKERLKESGKIADIHADILIGKVMDLVMRNALEVAPVESK